MFPLARFRFKSGYSSQFSTASAKVGDKGSNLKL